MQFLNKKEEVIDIALTSYGKYLLINGMFEPDSCAFFDDEIIYKLKNENQNDIKERILNTPIFNASHKSSLSKKNLLEHKIQNEEEKVVFLNETFDIEMIGTSRIGKNYRPSWEFIILNGSIKNTNILTYKSVFQLNDFEYKISLKDENISTINDIIGYNSTDLEDGRRIEIQDDYFLIEVSENNIEKNGSFEVELYEVIEKNGEEEFVKLFFTGKPELIKDGIMLDEDEVQNTDKFLELSSIYAETYFDVLVDSEIDRNIIEKTSRILEPIVQSYKTNIIPNSPTGDEPC